MAAWNELSYVGYSQVDSPATATLQSICKLYFDQANDIQHMEELWPLAIDVLKRWSSIVSEQGSPHSKPHDNFLIKLNELEVVLLERCNDRLCSEIPDEESVHSKFNWDDDDEESAESRLFTVQAIVKEIEERIDELQTAIALRNCGADPKIRAL